MDKEEKVLAEILGQFGKGTIKEKDFELVENILEDMKESLRDLHRELEKLGKEISRESEPMRKLINAWIVIHDPVYLKKFYESVSRGRTGTRGRGRPIKDCMSPSILMEHIKNKNGKPISKGTAIKLAKVLRYLKGREERQRLSRKIGAVGLRYSMEKRRTGIRGEHE